MTAGSNRTPTPGPAVTPTVTPATTPAPTTAATPATTMPATTTPAPAGAYSLITEPTAGMAPIYGFMSSATRSLDMTMYELADPQAEDILEADAHRGVAVRVILDKDYSGGSFNAPAYAALSANGVQVHWAPTGRSSTRRPSPSTAPPA